MVCIYITTMQHSRIPTEKGPESPDPAYTDMRYFPIISNMGLEKGDIVVAKHTKDSWEILSIGSRGKALIENTDTGKKSRVTDSWFKSVTTK